MMKGKRKKIASHEELNIQLREIERHIGNDMEQIFFVKITDHLIQNK